MRIPDSQAFIMILIMAGVTFFIRSLPFLLFPGNKKTPAYIMYLGKVLPFAIIGMLVVYCFKNVSVVSAPFGIPELIALIVIVILHVWKRNTLVSIGCGTLLYMFLVQVLF
ncbi:branched-chain amino acid transporter permease [uncultured Robinsoniella sp.]|uniref:branched-chain amino acid transporter permease n=1 Tax=uncultured Robinsoniella sp. TaxID=904190 RepID=UPI00374E3DD0